MANVVDKLRDTLDTAKKYWHTPPPGNYMSFKEILSLGLGGFGAHWVPLLAENIGLNAGNFILGACFGMRPMDLQIMLVVANLVGIPLGILRNYIYDNAHFKGGKFLPFVRHMALPLIIASVAFVWIPFEKMEYIQKAVLIEIMYLILNIFQSFYLESYQFLQQIVSPNTQERVNTMSITQIIFSLAPSISNFLIPTVAGLTYGLDDIRTYRLIYPLFTVVGLIFNNIFFRHVHERIVLPKQKQERIRLVDAIREVAKNKYFWITSLAGWLGFLEGASGVALSWTFVYGNGGKNAPMLGLVNTLIGNAALYPMILAPFAIKYIGKRNLLIGCNLINVLLLALMYPFYTNPVILVILVWLNTFVSVFYNIYYPGISADMRDYHQYKTGVRIDALFGVVGMLGTFIGFFTGFVVPYIYEKMGLGEDYSVLYDDTMRNNLLRVLIVAAVIGAIINVIPYFFYDLTEEKHRGYIKVLKIRAMVTDYRNNDLNDEELKEGVEIIHTARKLFGKEKSPLPKQALHDAKKLPHPKGDEQAIQKRNAAIHAARQEIRRVRQENDDIGNSPIVMEELEKYQTKRYQIMLEEAKKTVADGKGHLYLEADLKEKRDEAKKLPKNSNEERQIRSDALSALRVKKAASKLIVKHFPDGLQEPEEIDLDELENTENKKLSQVYREKKTIRQYLKKKSLYARAIKPYTDAENLLRTAHDYTFLDEIEEKYHQLQQAKNEASFNQ